MGLFSKKKKIIVSSVTYNLAGDIKDRVKFLSTAVAGHILSAPSSASLAETITKSLTGGPGVRFRNFSKWAQTSGYNDLIQLSAGSISIGGRVNQEALLNALPRGADETIELQNADVGLADYGYWADQYMAENHPTEIEENYEIDMDEAINTIYIRFPDGRVYSFQPQGFDYTIKYLYASYLVKKTDQKLEVVPGQTVQLGNIANWPDVSGWTYESGSSVQRTMTLNQTTVRTVTYSDGRPGTSETTGTSTTDTYEDSDYIWFKDDYVGQQAGSDQIVTDRSYQQNTTRSVKKSQTYVDEQTYDIGDGSGVKVTYKTVTTGEYRDWDFSYTPSKQKVIVSEWSDLKILIYAQGTGKPELDALFNIGVSSSQYFPFIPIRVGNRFIEDETYREANTRAIRRSTNSNYDKVEKQVADTPSLKDIDNAYMMFGVSLNTKEPAAVKYIFKFFDSILNQGAGGTAALTDWEIRWAAANESRLVWINWKQAQSDSANPLFGTPEPAQLLYPTPPTNSLNLYSSKFGFNITVEWTGISRIKGNGLAKPDAKRGDCWTTLGGTKDYNELLYTSGIVGERPSTSGFITITWQLTDTEYESIGVWGLYHTNIVYKGKGVGVRVDDAMRDTDESAFLIPLNDAIYRSLSLTVATQMSTSMAYMVFNCYDVVKQKWYQTSWFKIVLIIIIIVITVVTMGGGAGSAGLLGPSAAVGTSLGFSGTVAIIVGTVANAIAAMVLSQIITMGAKALFGEKVGAIVGAIASVIAVSVGTSMANGGTAMVGLENLASTENLLRLTVAAGQGIAGFMKAATAEVAADTQKLLNAYEEESSKIDKLYEQNIGYGITFIDPLSLTDATVGGGGNQNELTIAEGPDSFFSRTLMTGSDIIEMQQSMLTNFASMMTTTTLP
jgi:hypothetical protein